MDENTKRPSFSKVVVDASFILAKLLPDEKQKFLVSDYFERFAKEKISFFAPSLLKYEITNALRSAIAQRRLTLNLAKKILREFLKLPIDYKNIDFPEVLKLSEKMQISVYDTAYVFLAKTNKVPLLTLDKKLQKV